MDTVVFSSWGKELIDNRHVERDATPLQKDSPLLKTYKGKQIWGMIGWNGLVVWDKKVGVVEMVDRYLREALTLSCGECDACNLGLKAMCQIHNGIIQGESNKQELEAFAALARGVKETGKCNFGQTVTTPILDALQHYREEYDDLIERGKRDKGSQKVQYKAIITSPCMDACPVHMDAPGYIQMVKNNRVQEALSIIQETCILPGTVGRVCGHPCEKACKRTEIDFPIAIRAIKRYVTDCAYDQNLFRKEPVQQNKKEKVAIIGAGPAGLAAAYRLRLMGYEVTVFDKDSEPGGMGISGIPDYRLPKNVIKREVTQIEETGVSIRIRQVFGKDFGFNELWNQDYKALFLAVGAGRSKRISIPGRDLADVLEGIEFLQDVKAEKPVTMKDRVVVIGGGNVAIDCARTALRIGAKGVHVVCPESRQEMPASEMEISEALEENVILHASWGPSEIIGENGRVVSVVFQKCMSVFDEQGNFSPRCDITKTTKIATDIVIMAVGQEPDLFFLGKDNQIKATNLNTVDVELETLLTGQAGVFSGGDCVTGPATLIEAISHGNKAAQKIDQYLRTVQLRESDEEKLAQLASKLAVLEQREIGLFGKAMRQNPAALSPEERTKTLAEIESGLTKATALKETERCLRCYRLVVFAI